ncbi:MAG: hypothetical protein QOF30_3274 [Acidimicrobiaceae bacterium]|nr:hypothetical protein [Acidimicrobiaceae bacterium]
MTDRDQLVGDAATGGFELSRRELAVLMLPLDDGAKPVPDQKRPTSSGGHPRGNTDTFVRSRCKDTLVDLGVHGDGELW